MESLISFISDKEGNIVQNNDNLSSLYKITLQNLTIKPYEKKLLVNMLDRNYMVCKLPILLEKNNMYYWIFEPWKVGANVKITLLNRHIIIKPQLKDFNIFTEFEQEIIYSLLSGYLVDKDIARFLYKITDSYAKGNIKYSISVLYNKFSCNNRTDLVHSLIAHELNYYLPKSIFPTGEYPLN